MTVITVRTAAGRLQAEQRRLLARTLTDAVLLPEVGQVSPAARIGFQVYFVEHAPDMMAIGGELLSETPRDLMLIDVAVMEADWPREVRAQAIRRLLAAMAEACGVSAPSPAWWVNFRIIEEGSWGSRGDALSILDLLDSGVFTEERSTAIRTAIASRA